MKSSPLLAVDLGARRLARARCAGADVARDDRAQVVELVQPAVAAVVRAAGRVVEQLHGADDDPLAAPT